MHKVQISREITSCVILLIFLYSFLPLILIHIFSLEGRLADSLVVGWCFFGAFMLVGVGLPYVIEVAYKDHKPEQENTLPTTDS